MKINLVLNTKGPLWIMQLIQIVRLHLLITLEGSCCLDGALYLTTGLRRLKRGSMKEYAIKRWSKASKRGLWKGFISLPKCTKDMELDINKPFNFSKIDSVSNIFNNGKMNIEFRSIIENFTWTLKISWTVWGNSNSSVLGVRLPSNSSWTQSRPRQPRISSSNATTS